MKKILYILIISVVFGCYEDDNQLIQSQDASHRTSELSRMLKSITAHQTSYDNIIDDSSCFSLDFPYQAYVNSDLRTFSSVSDLSDLNFEDDIEIVYPVSATFFNYDTHQALNQTDFNLIKNTCSDGFDIIVNACLEIQFPIKFKEFNDITESFETFSFNNNEDVFFHLENLHDNDVYEIEYPIFLKDTDNNTILINSNVDFMEVFNDILQDCD
jgi:hypothetical protein